jgi:hypothetical protein
VVLAVLVYFVFHEPDMDGTWHDGQPKGPGFDND